MPYIVNKALKVQTRFKNRSEKGLKQLKEMKSDRLGEELVKNKNGVSYFSALGLKIQTMTFTSKT